MVLLGIISTNEAEKMSVKRLRTEEYFTFHLVLEFLGRWITIYAKQCIKMQEELLKFAPSKLHSEWLGYGYTNQNFAYSSEEVCISWANIWTAFFLIPYLFKSILIHKWRIFKVLLLFDGHLSKEHIAISKMHILPLSPVYITNL